MKTHLFIIFFLILQSIYAQSKLQATFSGEIVDKVYNTPVNGSEIKIFKRVIRTLPDGTLILTAPSNSELIASQIVTSADGSFSIDLSLSDVRYLMVEIYHPNYEYFTNRIIEIEKGVHTINENFSLLPINLSESGLEILEQKLEYEKAVIDLNKYYDLQQFVGENNANNKIGWAEFPAGGCTYTVPDSVFVTHLKNGYNGTTCPGAGFTGYINFQEYIAGVIQGEMGGFPLEAKKAQAVAARTYSLHRVEDGLSANCGQAYSFTPTATSLEAANSTIQQILLYDGSVCYGHYAARCDGTTTLNANEGVWSGYPTCTISGGATPYEISRPCSGHVNCSTTGEPCCDVFIPSKGINNHIYGHGVGLCQRGAQAFSGAPYYYDYQQILNAFYTDVCIANLPDTAIVTEVAPEIEWQNTIGGIDTDRVWAGVEQTIDGGYILGGHSYSGISGDKTEASHGGSDYWIIKLFNDGTIEWQNTIGGSGDEILQSIHQTADGGYILGGYSNSGISGDKTEANLGLYSDYWVVKLNSAGAIEWQNTIGGNGSDYLFSARQTFDGGFILGGHSYSSLSGDKTEGIIGGTYNDYWVIKLDPLGNILWQNTIGGINYDFCHDIAQTTDGGYILSGSSLSGISGDKTEANLGDYDYWVIKLNASGTIEWQNTIGGSLFDYSYRI